MKIILITLGIVLTSWLKYEWNLLIINRINVNYLYTIEYKTYNITYSQLAIESNLDDKTSKIFELMRLIDDKYEPKIFGGWVRDKIINHIPNDIDISIRARNIPDLSELNFNIKNILESKSENLNDTLHFEIPIEIRQYGHEKLRLYGKEVDLLIMAENRIISPPYVNIILILEFYSY